MMQVVLITGASSGLGEALAHIFHSAGCKVILASRNEVSLQRVKNELASKNPGVCIILLFWQFILVHI